MASQIILWHKKKYFGLKQHGPRWTAHNCKSATNTRESSSKVYPSPHRFNQSQDALDCHRSVHSLQSFISEDFQDNLKFPVGKRLSVFKWNLIRTQYSFYRNSLIKQHNLTALDIWNLHTILNISAWVRTWGLYAKENSCNCCWQGFLYQKKSQFNGVSLVPSTWDAIIKWKWQLQTQS